MMKRFLQTSLIAALLVPLCSPALGETMEERKQRIMRKYLRERQAVQQSDMILPDNTLEDERISDSERFQAVKMDLSRSTTAVPPPQQRMIAVPIQSQDNWLLDDEELVDDPYADPFAMDIDESTEESRADWWSEWQARQDAVAAEQQARTGSGLYDYGSMGEDAYPGSQPPTYEYGGSQDPSARSSSARYPQPVYTQQQPGQVGPYGTTRYGSSPSGMLQMPGVSQNVGTTPSSEGTATPGYTPYESPFQMKREQRQPGVSQQPEPQEFNRTSPYQRWKQDNSTWDPTADDAYVNELMRRNRR